VPHPSHLRLAGLEVAEVLLADAGLFIDADGGGVGVVLEGRREDALGCFARAGVRGGDDLEGVGGEQEGSKFVPCFQRLAAADGGEGDAVVGNGLVDRAVGIPDGLCVAN
jgi:hypothetical protein